MQKWHEGIERFDWVYEKCDKEALKLADRIREIRKLKDRSARGEKLEKNQQMKVADEGKAAAALLRELGSLPSCVFETFIQMVTSDGSTAAALRLGLKSLPLDSERSEIIRDLVNQAADSFAKERLELEARATEGMDSEAAEPLVDHVAQDEAVSKLEEHLSTSQSHQRRPRPRGGRSHHCRRYNADHM